MKLHRIIIVGIMFKVLLSSNDEKKILFLFPFCLLKDAKCVKLIGYLAVLKRFSLLLLYALKYRLVVYFIFKLLFQLGYT